MEDTVEVYDYHQVKMSTFIHILILISNSKYFIHRKIQAIDEAGENQSQKKLFFDSEGKCLPLSFKMNVAKQTMETVESIRIIS